MTMIWDRRATITVDTIQIQMLGLEKNNPGDLRARFEVTKTIRPEPNKCVLKLWNLSPTHRSHLEQLSPPGANTGVPIQIEGGYKEGTSTIFLGDVRTVITDKEGPDWVTTIGGGDGEKKIQASRVSHSFPKGTKPGDVVRELAKGLGVKPGNLNAAIANINRAFDGVFLGGTVITGSAAREMTRICRSLDLEWSVQNGALQILDRKAALGTQAIVLTDETGIIGSPTIGIDSKDKKQVLSLKMAMQADVFPGRILVVKGQSTSGQFRIEETIHIGDTRGSEWFIDTKSKRY